MQVEDYATTLLAGSAASFLRVESQRCPLKRSLGDAGLEMRFLREVWQCLQREPDRAVSLICGSLGAFDDGDVEATTLRLWRRAIHLLRQEPQADQLKRLARRLSEVRHLSGDQVSRLLKP